MVYECVQSVHSVYTEYTVCTGVPKCAQENSVCTEYVLSTLDEEILSKCAQYAQSVHKKCKKCAHSVLNRSKLAKKVA